MDTFSKQELKQTVLIIYQIVPGYKNKLQSLQVQ